jgi:molybdate transport system substrate-binding protein
MIRIEWFEGTHMLASSRAFRALLAGLGLAGVGALLGAPGLAVGDQAASPPRITVFAAADLVLAFDDLVPLFERSTGAKVTVVPGSTGTLAQQIQNGAPADLFFAASESYVDDLLKQGLILPETRVVYAQGRIVLAIAKTSGAAATALKDLLKPDIRRVAIANPAHAPYGLAAQQALQAVGIWDSLKPKLVYGENVRQALQFVQSGAAEAGIVARSVADVPEIRWTLLETSLHSPLNQAAAVLKRTSQPDVAKAFLRFVNGPEGRPIMKRFGFLVPGEF